LTDSSAGELFSSYRKIEALRSLVLGALLVSIICSMITDFILGPSGLDFHSLASALLDPDTVSRSVRVIVWEIRLPYALMAVAIGLALGLAGAEMQTVLANPLASPFTLGISSAAAFGAALAIVLQLHVPGVSTEWTVPANAFIFALCAALLLDLVARSRGMSASTIVLFGIALVFSFNALVSLLQFVASAEALQSMVYWTMGSLSQATWARVCVLFIVVAAVLPFSLNNSWRLTALRLGEDRASSFGIDVPRLRRGALLRISVLAALSVAFAGTIGFVGLISPHIARRLVGDDHRYYLPASALVGALVLSLASIASKNIIPGALLPVGIVTALVGIPFFLVIVLRKGGQL